MQIESLIAERLHKDETQNATLTTRLIEIEDKLAEIATTLESEEYLPLVHSLKSTAIDSDPPRILEHQLEHSNSNRGIRYQDTDPNDGLYRGGAYTGRDSREGWEGNNSSGMYNVPHNGPQRGFDNTWAGGYEDYNNHDNYNNYNDNSNYSNSGRRGGNSGRGGGGGAPYSQRSSRVDAIAAVENSYYQNQQYHDEEQQQYEAPSPRSYRTVHRQQDRPPQTTNNNRHNGNGDQAVGRAGVAGRGRGGGRGGKDERGGQSDELDAEFENYTRTARHTGRDPGRRVLLGQHAAPDPAPGHRGTENGEE